MAPLPPGASPSLPPARLGWRRILALAPIPPRDVLSILPGDLALGRVFGRMVGHLFRRPRPAAAGLGRLVLARRAAEAEHAAAAAARRRLALRIGGLVAWEVEPATGRIHADPGLAALFGIEEAAALDGTVAPFAARIHPQDRDRVRAAFAAAAAAGPGGTYRCEFRVVRATDGQVRWLEGAGEGVAGPGHGGLRVVGFNADVTERRAAAAALAESEARFRALFEGVPVGAVVVDPGTLGFVAFNGRACASLGFAREEFARLTLADLDPDHPAEAVRAKLRRVAASPPGERLEFERRRRARDPGAPTREVLVTAERVEVEGRVLVSELWLDVTERRAQERAVARMAGRHAAVLDALPLQVALLDPGGRVVSVNAAWRRFGAANGLPGDAAGGVGADYLAACAPAAAAGDAAAASAVEGLRAILAGRGARAEVLYPCHAPDGTERWFQLAAVPFADPTAAGGAGTAGAPPAGAVVAHLDVTERVRAARALAESEARLRSVVETAADGILVAAADGTIVSANPAALAIFGYGEADALVGRDLAVLMPPEDGARHGGYLAAHHATGRARAIGVPGRELRGRRRDGTEFPIELSVGSFQAADRALFFTGVVRDATLRVATEAALRRAGEERLRLAVEGTGLATWDADMERDEAVWSPGLFAMLGLPPDPEGRASWTLWAGRVHPEDLPAMREAFDHAAAAAGGDGRLRVTCRVLRADDGETRWLETLARFLPGPDGRPRAVGVVLDVTDRKAAEERQALLMREVDHRAKNAMAVAQSVVRLSSHGADPGAFVAAVEGRIAALSRAHSLLAQERWDGSDLQALAAAELAAQADRVSLSGPPVRLAPATVQPLAMALHELATNAAKYGALSRPEGRLRVSWRIDPEGHGGGALRLRWEERGGPPLAGAPGRRGFGSTVVEATIRRQLGGEARIAWEPEGLTCEVLLPPARLLPAGAGPEEASPLAASAAAAPRAAPPRAAPWAEAPLRGRRVLLAEDEALVALELEASLRALGCAVVGPARTAEEALRLAAGDPALDAAVLDVNLDGRMVFPAADLLALRGVPVVYVTGYEDLPQGRAGEGPRMALLRKPPARGELEAALRRLLAGAAAAPPPPGAAAARGRPAPAG